MLAPPKLYSQRVANFEYLKRVLNISNPYETFATSFVYLQRVWNICNVFCFKRVANLQNTFQMFQTRC